MFNTVKELKIIERQLIATMQNILADGDFTQVARNELTRLLRELKYINGAIEDLS